MKKIFKDHGYESLLPAGEASQDINRKEIDRAEAEAEARWRHGEYQDKGEPHYEKDF